METNYFFKADPKTHTIEFSTNNEELYADVRKYISNCIDAVRWNSRVEELKTIIK